VTRTPGQVEKKDIPNKGAKRAKLFPRENICCLRNGSTSFTYREAWLALAAMKHFFSESKKHFLPPSHAMCNSGAAAAKEEMSNDPFILGSQINVSHLA